VIREPAELSTDDEGRVVLPLWLVAEAGLDAGSQLLASGDKDGHIVLLREARAVESILRDGTL
jgi:bifunctional DNA-binding transcriptional regulator/antitoxin component of YhaV-PrlF toxin-antitoxin module